MFCRVCNISVGLCLRKQAEICPKNVVTKNPELCKICDRHVFHLDLYFSVWVTKLDAVKGSNRTYPYSKESVKLWWVYAWENMQKSVPKVLQPKFPIYAKFAIGTNCILTSFFSTSVTKFDAVKGSNRTYTCSEESVKFWWLFDLI